MAVIQVWCLFVHSFISALVYNTKNDHVEKTCQNVELSLLFAEFLMEQALVIPLPLKKLKKVVLAIR